PFWIPSRLRQARRMATRFFCWLLLVPVVSLRSDGQQLAHSDIGSQACCVVDGYNYRISDPSFRKKAAHVIWMLEKTGLYDVPGDDFKSLWRKSILCTRALNLEDNESCPRVFGNVEPWKTKRNLELAENGIKKFYDEHRFWSEGYFFRKPKCPRGFAPAQEPKWRCSFDMKRLMRLLEIWIEKVGYDVRLAEILPQHKSKPGWIDRNRGYSDFSSEISLLKGNIKRLRAQAEEIWPKRFTDE
ncbi:unnamed protein product, partial [Cladocopium goreaui]